MQIPAGLNDKLVGAAESQVPSVFLLINVAVRRAEQLVDGAVSPVSGRVTGPIELALREIAEGNLASDEEYKVWTLKSED